MVVKSNSELRIGNVDSQQKYTESRNTKRVAENDAVMSESLTGVIVETLRDVSFCSDFEVWLSAAVQNIAGGDTLTIKFYKKFGNDKILAETVTVETPAVTALESQKVDVVTTDAEIDSYDFYTISGTVTLVATGTCNLNVSKRSQGGGSDVNIDGITPVDGNLPVLEGAYEISSVPAAAAVTAASSAVTLTKAEILNDGVHTIFYRDNGGDADVDDTPLYPGERIGPLTGIIRVICAAAETSTLRITEFV